MPVKKLSREMRLNRLENIVLQMVNALNAQQDAFNSFNQRLQSFENEQALAVETRLCYSEEQMRELQQQGFSVVDCHFHHDEYWQTQIFLMQKNKNLGGERHGRKKLFRLRKESRAIGIC